MQRWCRSILQVIFVSWLSALFMVSCATIPLPTRSDRTGESGPSGSCANFFASLDKRIEQAGVIDPGVFRVDKYPYLRTNRFLASFREELDNEAAFAAWMDRMQALDQDARKYEIANLPDSAVAGIDAITDKAALNSKVETCGDLLKKVDFQSIAQRERLKKSVSVSGDYIALRRILGLYPLTRVFVSSGVSRWHAEARSSYAPRPPADWKTIRYIPAIDNDMPSAGHILESVGRDALGIPNYSSQDRARLFRMYAPVWEVQYQGNYDRIGAPVWSGRNILDVDTATPATYTLMSFTRFNGDIFTQLNYIIWFPERPKQQSLDIYGGILDGVNYRVTLDHKGDPILYETMHNCGCYYKAYPTDRLQVRANIDYAEPPLILESPTVIHSKDMMTVAMESRTHYVQHLYPLSRASRKGMEVYSLVDYGRLRSLPYLKDLRRSMFGQDSLAPGSKRLERFILWPTGVLSPGAMRQSGRHAVAFVGKRHFDDPFFMDKMYLESEYVKLIKSLNLRHAYEGRHPEYSENTGFPPSRE